MQLRAGMVGLVASLLALSAAPAVALRYSPVPRAGAGPGRCPSQPSKPGPAITGLAEHKLAGSFDQRKAAARDIGQKAYVYGFPLVDEDRILDTLRTTPGAGVNRFIDVDRLGSPGDRTVVAPNSDTLYSLAELDVRDEPIVLSVPSTGGRWYDMELVEPYTNVFGYVGQRVSGTHAGDYAVVGPHWGGKVPKGMRCVRAPADRVWLIGRTLVAGPDDLDAARTVQRRYQLAPLSKFGKRGAPPAHAVVPANPEVGTPRDGLQFFDALSALMASSPPPARDKGTLKTLATIGIAPGGRPSRNPDAAVRQGLVEGIAAAKAALRADFVRVSLDSATANNGWLHPPPQVGAFGNDYVLRANAAIYGIGINRPVEAVYLIGVLDSQGRPLSPERTYRITFPPGGQPPVDAWWSLTMYDSDGFLVANPLGRYAISDRSGAQPGPDGSLTLFLGADPRPGQERNWLPVPAAGMPQPFLRAYSLRDQAWNPPPIVPT